MAKENTPIVNETPVVETPSVETPVVETPSVETPVVETPVTTTTTRPEDKIVVNSVVEETVTIKKVELDELMKRLERVEAAADKSQLANFDAKHRGKFSKVAKLRTINGKVVVGWSDMLVNTVERNPLTGIWKEDQRIKLQYEDGTDEEMDFVIFNRRFQYILGTVVKESRDMETGEMLYDIKSDDGRLYQNINIKFVN